MRPEAEVSEPFCDKCRLQIFEDGLPLQTVTPHTTIHIHGKPYPALWETFKFAFELVLDGDNQSTQSELVPLSCCLPHTSILSKLI